MRHYIPKRNNPYKLPHALYMQMLYLIRDHEESGDIFITRERKRQWMAVEFAAQRLKQEYGKRHEIYGVLKPLQAFFDYAYFSYMFAACGRETGASKPLWSLYRSRFAYLVAEELGLVQA